MIKEKVKKYKKGKPDKFILGFSLLMTIFGMLMIYNASAYLAQQEFNDQFHFIKLQFIWVLFGIFVGLIIYFIDYHNIAKIIGLAFLLNLVILILVLIFGIEINGAKRWFDINGIVIQPAEFVKPVIIFYLGSWLAKYSEREKKVNEDTNKEAWRKAITYTLLISTAMIPIILQPDMGTALVIAISLFVLYLIFSSNKLEVKNILKMFGIALIPLIIELVRAPYRLERIITYLQLIFTGEVADPRGTGYQLNQILIGIGSSGFWGKGFGQSRQRFGYLVENTAFTDSTFAVVLEEFGMLSAFLILGAFIFFFIKGMEIAKKAPDLLGKAVATGITLWIVIQTFFNMAANVGLVPITGLPFPFLTYGGSSTIVTLASMAILLNISQYGNIEEKKGIRNVKIR